MKKNQINIKKALFFLIFLSSLGSGLCFGKISSSKGLKSMKQIYEKSLKDIEKKRLIMREKSRIYSTFVKDVYLKSPQKNEQEREKLLQEAKDAQSEFKKANKNIGAIEDKIIAYKERQAALRKKRKEKRMKDIIALKTKILDAEIILLNIKTLKSKNKLSEQEFSDIEDKAFLKVKKYLGDHIEKEMGKDPAPDCQSVAAIIKESQRDDLSQIEKIFERIKDKK